MHPGQIGTWAWRQFGYVSARFNEKIKEACFAVVTRIQAPKIFRTHNVELEASRIFPFNLVPSTRLQACAEDMEKHISDHFGLSTSFGGPRGACGQPSNGFPWRTSTRFSWWKQVRKRSVLYTLAHVVRKKP